MGMKEIKFRLVKDDKIVGYEKHTQNKGGFQSSIFHSITNDNYTGYEWSNITCVPARFIDCDFKEQYIDLKLKGKEVYVGDRVYIAGVGICVVEYSSDLLAFVFVSEETENEWLYHEVIEDIEEVVEVVE